MHTVTKFYVINFKLVTIQTNLTLDVTWRNFFVFKINAKHWHPQQNRTHKTSKTNLNKIIIVLYALHNISLMTF